MVHLLSQIGFISNKYKIRCVTKMQYYCKNIHLVYIDKEVITIKKKNIQSLSKKIYPNEFIFEWKIIFEK